MPVDIIGIDHVFIDVNDLAKAEAFYDKVMPILGFRKGKASNKVSPRLRYDCRLFTYWVRLVPSATEGAEPGRASVPHLCFRVVDEATVDRACRELQGAGIQASEPKYHTQYSDEYYATFFSDPDGALLEVMNFGERRRKRMLEWDSGEKKI